MLSRHGVLERHSLILSIAILIVVSIGGIVQLAPLFYLENTIEEVEGVRPYTPLELAGRNIYIREGCYTCHSQMIRPLRDEVERYGHYSLAAESMYDHPFLWGSKRTGPDLARVGGKYPNSWHWIHFRDPRAMEPRSNMPPYAFLAEWPLDLSDTSRKLAVLSDLGHPYSEAQIASAADDARAQAQAVVAALRSDGQEIGEAQAQSEMVALIAYLQRLGKDLAASGVAR
jgi:cytochrome c oxidase cbb3-type subunit 2